MRRAIWIFAPILLLLVVISRTAELNTLARILLTAHPGWLVAALGLQVVFALNQGAFYQAVFRLLDTAVSLGTAVWLALVMAFGSLATPVGATAGVAFFVVAARDRGLSPSRALLASLSYYFFDYAALLVVLLAGAAVQLVQRDLQPSQLTALVVFAAVMASGTGLAIRLIAVPTALSRWMMRMAGVLNWVSRGLRRPPAISRERLARWVHEVQEVVAAVRARPRHALRPALHALGVQAVGLATLSVVFRAIGEALPPGVLVAGYAVGTFLMIVSITPSGAGVTEGGMIVTFSSLGVPLETAVAGALLFRLVAFWLPMVAGFLSLHAYPARASGGGSA
ncbi:MAG: lysylphosphatidylglycerol synthase transmembrane domain-containing protein [Armatimonadota bacterium]|nr:lysylphosphatidylglycerol synthase transmembrane domain-containing protein [Armatimonadota bacterium]MDR7426298.1 lysylphosphatidylglycerol synthase transmembrane domain-containing protein [Armatimonadota bacterium]MDR7463275.1 lysylphosphatidylglycerol synthase transmembrane domain-containing protein [Armatimonadota bacterium]MDR7470979.1 lysylphosphatidylglycerol synthase transmembrane domain-containing protein [Armatimonadota bacterium]MDR7474717.1 lysylphosphatidylglycerol synthase trans